MNARDLADLRMRNLRLSGVPLERPAEVVRWLGAVQSQEFGPAKWSIAERAVSSSEADLDRAFDEGAILRTHILRPTWHFVLPEDIGWMLDLTGPRVRKAMAAYDRKLGIDAALMKRCRTLIVKALRREGHLTRQELRAVLEKAGIEAQGQRLNHIVLNVELDAVICSGGLRGKKHTYALLEERAPAARSLPRDEALAELTRRYFTSHGPATAKDFRWWSTLPAADVRRGLEMVEDRLQNESVDGSTYWFTADAIPRRRRASRVHLLQPYDECVVGYTESRHLLDRSGEARGRFPEIFSGAILVDGQVTGSYRRSIAKGSLLIDATLFRPLTTKEDGELAAAVRRLGAFTGMEVTLTATAA